MQKLCNFTNYIYTMLYHRGRMRFSQNNSISPDTAGGLGQELCDAVKYPDQEISLSVLFQVSSKFI